MDIAKKLDDILFKHHIIEEKDMTGFRLEVEKLATYLNNGFSIAMYGAGKESRSLIQNILEYFPQFQIDKCFGQNKEPYRYKNVVRDTKVEPINSDNVRKYSIILIGSRTYSAVFKENLKQMNYDGIIFDLYEVLGKYIDDHFSDHQLVYNARKNFLCADQDSKQDTLANLIKQFILIKDFVNFYRYIDIYVENKYGEYETYLSLKKEVQQLVIEIKNCLGERKHRDIVVNWIDAISYYDMGNFDFLSCESKKGTFFENAYTTIPWTSDAMRSILFANYPIEGKLFLTNNYSKENSIFIKMLSQYGYKFSYCGIDRMAVLYGGEDVIIPVEIYNNKYDSSTTKQWNAVQLLCQYDFPLCIIVHNLNETHMPYVCGLTDTFIDFDVMPKDWADERCQKQADISGKYLDEQLAFYSELYGEQLVRVYMSDHGRRGNSCMKDDKIHILLFALGAGIEKKVISSMFSLIDLYKLIENIVCNRDLDDEKYAREHIVVENLDPYSKVAVEKVLSGFKVWEEMRQCRGVVTKTDRYFKHQIGNEYYYKSPKSLDNEIDDSTCKDRIDQLRELCGNEFIDIYQYEKFKCARQLYDQKA